MTDLLTVSEAATLLRVSTKTVYELVRTKSLPGAAKIGGIIRINRETLLAWINSQWAA